MKAIFCFYIYNHDFYSMKILMVCLGNICRSPLAHGIMQDIIDKQGLGWEVDSAGTGDWHVGHAPDRRSVAVAREKGIDISQQRAQHFKPSFFDKYDYIFVMDDQNYKDVISLAKTREECEKVSLFIPKGVVPDPYYDDTMFEPVFAMVKDRCESLVNELKILRNEGSRG